MRANIIIGIEKYRVIARITIYDFFKCSHTLNEIYIIFQRISEIKELSFSYLKKVNLEDSLFIITPNEDEEHIWYKNNNLVLTAERLCNEDEKEKYEKYVEKYPNETHCPILGATILKEE